MWEKDEALHLSSAEKLVVEGRPHWAVRDPASCGSSSELFACWTAEVKGGHLDEVIMVTP